MDETVVVRRFEGGLHVELARPEKRNALTADMYRRLADTLAVAEQDDTVASVVFSGRGEAFCAGNDLGDFVANPPASADAPVFRFLRGLASADKILIAAVHGRAVGIGTTMLLHCDFVVAEAGALFSLPFVDLGLVPEAASSLLLPALIGQRRAAELLLLGETMTAARAEALGLINTVADPGQALGAALDIARRLAGKPAGALRASKQLMKLPASPVAERMAAEQLIFEERLRSRDVQDRIAAFFTRR